MAELCAANDAVRRAERSDDACRRSDTATAVPPVGGPAPGKSWSEQGRLQSAGCRPSPGPAVCGRGNKSSRPAPDSFPDSGLIEDLPARELHRGLFHLLFGREPAPDDPFVAELENGTKSPRQLMEWLIHSAE